MQKTEICYREFFEKEFGFDGFVMTDWTSSDTCDIVKAVDAETAGSHQAVWKTQPMQIVKGVEDGKIDRKRLEKKCIQNVPDSFEIFLKNEIGLT